MDCWPWQGLQYHVHLGAWPSEDLNPLCVSVDAAQDGQGLPGSGRVGGTSGLGFRAHLLGSFPSNGHSGLEHSLCT